LLSIKNGGLQGSPFFYVGAITGRPESLFTISSIAATKAN
jgi:hypothetical protein